MQTEHWGALPVDDETSAAFVPDKYVPTSAKKAKLDEIRQRGELIPLDKQ